LGGSISFASVGLALAAAFLTGSLASGLLAWSLGAFLVTLVFLLVFALEIGLA
jgi:hypothetical protein